MAPDFYVLTYTLAEGLISHRSFIVSLLCIKIWSENKDILTFSFLVCICLILFSFLLILQIIDLIIMVGMKKNRHHCQVPNVSGNALSYPPFKILLAEEMLQIAFIIFQYMFCIHSLCRPFNNRGCRFCQKQSFCL